MDQQAILSRINIKSVAEPDERLRQAAELVFRGSGVKVKIEEWGVTDELPLFCCVALVGPASFDPSVHPEYRLGVATSPDLLNTFNNEQLMAIMAHEAGHVVNGDLTVSPADLTKEQVFDSEFKADAFVVKMGLGEAFISALTHIGKRSLSALLLGDPLHPPIIERIARLKRLMSQKAMGAAA